jgi:thioredoxin reductase (NADPH)
LHGSSGDATELESVVVEGPDRVRRELPSRRIFCFIGSKPETQWIQGVDIDAGGFVETNGSLPFQTSHPRVFAAGDVRSGSMKRVAVAVGEGAGAVASVHLELQRAGRRSG